MSDCQVGHCADATWSPSCRCTPCLTWSLFAALLLGGGGGSYSAHVGGHFTKAAPSSIYPGTFLRTGSAQEVMRQTGAGKEKTFWAGGRGVGGA